MADGLINKGSKIEICVTPQVGAKTLAEVKALTYVELCCPETQIALRKEANNLTANCMNGEKLTAVGFDTESTAELTVFYKSVCPSQDALRGAIATQTRFAMRKVLADATATTTATIVYFIAKVSAGTYGGNGGGGEDFVVDEYTLLIDEIYPMEKPTTI